MSALCLQYIFSNKLYVLFEYMHYLLYEKDAGKGKRGMIEGGLKLGDSFGSDVTKIKYCTLKRILSDLHSHARCVLTIRKIHFRYIL